MHDTRDTLTDSLENNIKAFSDLHKSGVQYFTDMSLFLVKRMRTLEKELEWVITRAVEDGDLCTHRKSCDVVDISDATCIECWKEAAREATQ